MAKKKLARPTLSIGIIYKNEIRCLERCLSSLAPLRKRVPCELIMADTGSEDGSREIAARHADVLFDFPWVDDFSAARNAVLEKATGEWYLSIDADEWLDKDISELAGFFHGSYAKSGEIVSLIVRNYYLSDSDSEYADIQGLRLVRRMPWTKFEGRIHERFVPPAGRGWNITTLGRTVLHHDGYVCLNEGHGEEKLERNLTLLRKELEDAPEDLNVLLQYMESGRDTSDWYDVLKKAVELVERKCPLWDYDGPVIFRHAVMDAFERKLPEFEEWIARSETWFPNSFFTRIDVEYLACGHSWEKKDYADCVRRGKRYLQAMKDYRNNRGERLTLMSSALLFGSVHDEQQIRIYMARAWVEEGEHQKALQLLERLDGILTDETHAKHLLSALSRIQAESTCDTSIVIRRIFKSDCQNVYLNAVPSRSDSGLTTGNQCICGNDSSNLEQSQMKVERAAEHFQSMFMQEGMRLFSREYREKEQGAKYYYHPAYTLFLPLSEECDLGRAAAVLETGDLNEIKKWLVKVEEWSRFPMEALFHAISLGLDFPVEGIDFSQEEMSALVSMFDWKADGDGMAVARFFVKSEKALLEKELGQETLKKENLPLLQSKHQFGWHCVRAFEALETGDFTKYVRELRESLEENPNMSDMVEYLVNHTPQLQERKRRKEEASAELLALAEQVKMILANYEPDNPTVAALKSSPAYQKVAWLLEEEAG